MCFLICRRACVTELHSLFFYSRFVLREISSTLIKTEQRHGIFPDLMIYYLRSVSLIERRRREPLLALAILLNHCIAVILQGRITAAAPILLNRTNVFAEEKIQRPIEGDADLFVQSG